MLTGTFFLLLLIGTSLLSIKIVQRAGINILEVSLSSFFILFYIFIAHLPIFILFEHLDAYRVILGMTDQTTIMWMAVYSCTALLMVSLGIFVAARLPQLSSVPNQKTITIPLKGSSQFGLLLATLTCAAAIALYAKQLEVIPILQLFSDTGGDVASARSAAGNQFQGRLYLYSIFITGVAPFVCYASYATVRYQGGMFLRMVFLLSLVISVGGAVITTSKGQLVALLLGLILVHILSGSGRVNVRTILIGSALVLLPVLAMYYFIFYQGRPSHAIVAMVSRIVGASTTAYYYLEVIPRQIDYLQGTSFPSPGGVFPWKPFPLTIAMQNTIHPEYLVLGQGSMPSVFWAELHANWGYLGVVFFAPFIGFLIRFWDGVLARFPRTPLTAALTAWMAIHFSKMIGRFFFSTHIFDVYLLTVLIVFLGLTLINGNPLMIIWRNSRPNKKHIGA